MEHLPTSAPPQRLPSETLPAGWCGFDAPPLEVDVGCHRGRFLVAMAERHPEKNFLGIEKQTNRVLRARRKIAARDLSNAAVVEGEGLAVLSQLGADCVEYLHVLFPDPWPKRRHHIRRLVQERFLQVAHRILQPGGYLRLVTDDSPYAAAMDEAARDCSFLTRIEQGEERAYPPTEFQIKFLGDARKIHSLILRKICTGKTQN